MTTEGGDETSVVKRNSSARNPTHASVQRTREAIFSSAALESNALCEVDKQTMAGEGVGDITQDGQIASNTYKHMSWRSCFPF